MEQTCVHTGMLGTIGPRVLILLVGAAYGDTKWRSALLHTSRLVHRKKLEEGTFGKDEAVLSL